MTLPKAIHPREYKKFVNCPSGSDDVAVRTTICQEPGSTISVDIVEDGSAGTVTNVFTQITNVAAGSPTTITTYTVPAGKVFFLKKVEASGENRAKYTVRIAGSDEGVKRTYNNDLNVCFEFFNYQVAAGVTLLVEVEHDRSPTNEFDARILGNLV